MSKTYLYRNNDGLVRWAVSLLYIHAAICAAAAVSGYLELDLLGRMKTEAMASYDALMAEADASDRRQRVLTILQIVSLVVTGITSMVWVYRANVNARAMGAQLETSPGWAVGWFFIPIASLFMPFQAMSDLWKGSASPANWREQPIPELLMRGWWGFFLIANMIGAAGARLRFRAEELDDFIWPSRLVLASDVLDIVAALLFAAVIRGIHGMQRPPAAPV